MLYLLHQAVDQAATRDGEHEAVCCNGIRLTYAQLAEQSGQLAHTLRTHGIERGDRVGLFMDKSVQSAVAIHGAMKAGAAYVPLDPKAPVARLAYILRDCGIRHLITEPSKVKRLRQLVSAEGVGLTCLVGVEPDDALPGACLPWDEVAHAPATVPGPGPIEQDLAYILYTSGSTGVPKGVMHTHRSALSFAEVAARTYGFDPTDRISNHAPLHFDLSTLDFFATAVAGATTVVIPEMYTKLPASLSKLMEEERLTVLYAVPLALRQLLQHGALDKRDLGALRWVLFGGEPFPTKHLRRLMDLLPDARFSNVYGPTETNGCTYYLVPPLAPDVDDPIPIGGLYENVEALIVDADDELVAPGTTGELLVRSPTRMQGYWNRPDLTEQATYYRPADGQYAEPFHRTGDLVYEQDDGMLMFVGRKDRQVKVRGYRIELDEIEVVLLAHAGVEIAAVFTVLDEDSPLRIEAAVQAASGVNLSVKDLTQHAAEHLPPYAVPERITLVDQFPRTSTGKIDRRALSRQAQSSVHPASA